MPGNNQTSSIFISYRRDDSEGHVGRLRDSLAERLGDDAQIFYDIETIKGGEDFVKKIGEAVTSCDVLLAVIGRQWLTIKDEDGARRLDNPQDFVRLEIEGALGGGVRVIPVLVSGATMPRARDLPASLAGLTRLNAAELSSRYWREDVGRLVAAIGGAAPRISRRRPVALACGVAALVLLALAAWWRPWAGRPDVSGAASPTPTAEVAGEGSSSSGGAWGGTGAATPTPQTAAAESVRIPPAERPFSIVNIFEGGRPGPRYPLVLTWGGDIMYGHTLARLSDGSLHALIRSYCEIPGARFAGQFRPYLARLSDKDGMLAEDATFVSLLKRAGGEDPAMVDLQREVFERTMWSRVRQEVDAVGVKTPLGVTVIYDTIYNLGPRNYERLKMGAIDRLDGTPATGVDERRWITTFLGLRAEFFSRQQEPLKRAGTRRTASLAALAGAGNWDLTAPLTVEGYTITD